MTDPVLYTFRRCPYAMRARMALKYSGISVRIREVVLKDKPESLLDYSAKGEVPVLVISPQHVIDQSLDIMRWALAQHDPLQWFSLGENKDVGESLIEENDGDFKYFLDRYKYADRYPQHPLSYYRQQTQSFVDKLESQLTQRNYLLGMQPCWVDVAIFPFIRQFAHVEADWFSRSYPYLQQWLNNMMAMPLFAAVMKKYAQWQPGNEEPLL